MVHSYPTSEPGLYRKILILNLESRLTKEFQNTFYLLFILLLKYFSSSLDWDKYKWTGIGDEGTTALADVLRLPTKSFKKLK